MSNSRIVRGKGISLVKKTEPIEIPILNYSEVRNHFKSGDVLGWCGEGALSDGIKWFTKSETTHISVILQEIEADIKRWKQMEAYEGGHGIMGGHVAPTFISKRMKEYNGFPVWYQLHKDLDPYREAIRKQLWTYAGTDYDYGSLVKNIFGRVVADDDKLFCSELKEFAFREAVPLDFWLSHSEWLKHKAMQIFLGPRACVPGDSVQLPFLKLMGRLELKNI